MSLHKAIKMIRQHKRFLISSHVNLEGDALGSEIAFYRLLKYLGKQALIVNEDTLPYGYAFLPHVDKIEHFSKDSTKIDFDCFAVLDCSDIKRTGMVHTLSKPQAPVLNIDHHISNTYFGSVNWVDAGACCCCELVYKLYKALKVPLDKRSAMALYAGILTDTGSYRHSNTSVMAHRITAELLEYGLDVAGIYRQIYGTVPYPDLKLLSAVLPTMQMVCDGKVVYFQIHKGLLRKYPPVSFDLGESILTFGRMLKDVEVVVLFKENLCVNNQVRVNFRSQGKVDVNKIAAFFNGGGHRTASGATIQGPLASVKRKVLEKIKETL